MKTGDGDDNEKEHIFYSIPLTMWVQNFMMIDLVVRRGNVTDKQIHFRIYKTPYCMEFMNHTTTFVAAL